MGFEDPFLCSELICNNAIIMINIGKRKCKLKKRLRVLSLTEKPPQIHLVILSPIMGIAVSRFVITVAPQKDI